MASVSGDAAEMKSYEDDQQLASDEFLQSTEFNARKASDEISDSFDLEANNTTDNAGEGANGEEILRQPPALERQRSSTEHRKSIDLRHSKCKKQCKISDMVLISDNYLAVADHANMCVFIVNTGNNKITECILLPANPTCLAKLPDDRLAVALPFRQRIRLINVQNPKNFEEIKTNGRCTAMGCCNGNLLISISEAGFCRISMIDLKGNILREVIKKTDAVKKIMVNPEQTVMYATQVFQNKVLFVTIASGLVKTYTEKNLRGPKGLALAGNGDLIVCGKESLNLYQLTPEASLQGTEDLSYMTTGKPEAIALHQTTKMLYIACEGSDHISCLYVPDIIEDEDSPKNERKWWCQIL